MAAEVAGFWNPGLPPHRAADKHRREGVQTSRGSSKRAPKVKLERGEQERKRARAVGVGAAPVKSLTTRKRTMVNDS